MDIFGGNKQLEAAVFTGIDMALFSRHNTTNTITPAILVFKGGQITHQLVGSVKDPNAFMDNFLQKPEVDFEQVAIYMEGQVSGGDDRKHDAMLVKAFDRSMPSGLLVGQRFVPMESGQPFSRLGRPALFDNSLPMPLPVIERKTPDPDAPYVSSLVVDEADGSKRSVITAGHSNPSMLANELKVHARDLVKEADERFSGKIEIRLMPDMFTVGSFETWLFNELITRIKEEPAVTRWERTSKKQLQITVMLNAASE